MLPPMAGATAFRRWGWCAAALFGALAWLGRGCLGEGGVLVTALLVLLLVTVGVLLSADAFAGFVQGWHRPHDVLLAAARYYAALGRKMTAAESVASFVLSSPWRLFGPTSGALGFFALAAPAPFLWRHVLVGGRWWAASLLEMFGIVVPAVLGQVSARRQAGWAWVLFGGAASAWAVALVLHGMPV